MIGWTELLSEWPDDVVPRYNVYPSYPIAAFATPTGQTMRWGMVPSWAKSFDSKYATHNARIETVESKPAFRNAWRRSQRCLIPMAGFYERPPAGDRQFHYVTDRDTGGLVVAGLYEPWGADQFSCTMITKPADEPLVNIHSRTPVLLTPDAARDWLEVEEQQAKQFLYGCKLESLILYPVDNAVGNARNDYPELIEPIDL